MSRRKFGVNRTSKSMRVRKNVYISCEGDAEENYIKGLKEQYRGKATIKVCNSPKTDAYGVVLRLRDEFGHEYEKDDLKFCIFDCDENSQETIQKALRFAKKESAKVIFSNPCFEIWLLWHYSNELKHQSSRDELKDRIEKLIVSGYWKKENNLFALISSFTEKAQKIAEKRRSEVGLDKKFSVDNNPCTNFDEFLSELENFLLIS